MVTSTCLQITTHFISGLHLSTWQNKLRLNILCTKLAIPPTPVGNMMKNRSKYSTTGNKIKGQQGTYDGEVCVRCKNVLQKKMVSLSLIYNGAALSIPCDTCANSFSAGCAVINPCSTACLPSESDLKYSSPRALKARCSSPKPKFRGDSTNCSGLEDI